MRHQTDYSPSSGVECTADVVLAAHARKRMDQRGVSEQAVLLTLRYGRKIHSRRTVFHVIGRKEIARYGKQVPELLALDGVQVITSQDEHTVVTVYRNHDLRGIRPTKRKHRHLH